MNTSDQISKPISIRIPRDGDALDVTVSPGKPLYILGANGSGKSAFVSYLAQKLRGHSLRLVSAHRQNWLQGDAPTFPPHQREQQQQQYLQQIGQWASRYRDNLGSSRLGLILNDIITSHNDYNEEVVRRVDDQDETVFKYRQIHPSPLQQINEVLRQGALEICLRLRNGSIENTTSSGQLVGISKLSDGERNAIMLAAEVLTAPKNCIVLVDEPERHLHRAIVVSLLRALFSKRLDCMFIIATHEVDFAAQQVDADVCMLRQCRWKGDAPASWSAELLPANAPIPEDLRRAILGSKPAMLFIEGGSTSLDVRIYAVLFPQFSVRPVQSCRDVIALVRGVKRLADYGWVSAQGLIDRDDRNDDEVHRLGEEGIHALDVYSVESLLYSSAVVDGVAKMQAKVHGVAAEYLKRQAVGQSLEYLRRERSVCERLCALRSERKVRDTVLSRLPKAAELASLDAALLVENIPGILEQERNRFASLLRDNNFDGLVGRYKLRESQFFDRVASELHFRGREDYENAAVNLVQRDEELRDRLYKFLPNL